MQVLSSFILCPPGVSRSPIPSRAVVIRSSLGLSIIASAGVTPPTFFSCWQPDLCVQSHSWSKARIGGRSPYPIQWVSTRRMDHLRANPGFGVFWFILTLLAVAYLQPTSFIGRIFFGLSGVGVALSQTGWSDLDWPIRGVRIWKLSRTYPSDKPPLFSLPMQRYCFATRNPTRHLLTIPNIPVGMKFVYEGPMTSSAPHVQKLWR